MSYIGRNEDEWEAEQKKKAKERRRKETEFCELCEKRFKNLDAHLKAKHGVKRTRLPKYRYENIS